MKQTESYKILEGLGQALLTTKDAAAALRISPARANKVLSRLAEDRFVTHLCRGHWSIGRAAHPLTLPEHLAAPFPAYVSLHTALFHHGMISQIPEVFYAVTLAKPRRILTPLGVVSLHRIEPDFFFGFEPCASGGMMMATPEKALLDSLYLSPSRSRLFTTLPELELPKKFSWKKARDMAQRIPSSQRRTLVEKRLAALLDSGGPC
jgi:predicted transcriptional regulator of viral defense system